MLIISFKPQIDASLANQNYIFSINLVKLKKDK